MARRRKARRCSARRTSGVPCRAFAIVGGYVCRAHGGASRQVRYAAEIRQVEAWTWGAAMYDWHRHRERLVEFNIAHGHR